MHERQVAVTCPLDAGFATERRDQVHGEKPPHSGLAALATEEGRFRRLVAHRHVRDRHGTGPRRIRATDLDLDVALTPFDRCQTVDQDGQRRDDAPDVDLDGELRRGPREHF